MTAGFANFSVTLSSSEENSHFKWVDMLMFTILRKFRCICYIEYKTLYVLNRKTGSQLQLTGCVGLFEICTHKWKQELLFIVNRLKKSN